MGFEVWALLWYIASNWCVHIGSSYPTGRVGNGGPDYVLLEFIRGQLWGLPSISSFYFLHRAPPHKFQSLHGKHLTMLPPQEHRRMNPTERGRGESKWTGSTPMTFPGVTGLTGVTLGTAGGYLGPRGCCWGFWVASCGGGFHPPHDRDVLGCCQGCNLSYHKKDI